MQYSETNGDAFSYSFVGNGVDYVTEKDPSQGEVEIYVDGALKATVDTHADTRSAQQLVYSISDLPNGSHTIRGVKKSGQFMLLDKLVVRRESLLNPGTAAFDKSAQADVSTESGRDPGELAGIANGGKNLAKGTGVDWITALGPDQGQADVYIDNKLVIRVNLANDARVTARQVFTRSGLKDGQHILRIVKVSGDVLRNDLIRYTLGK